MSDLLIPLTLNDVTLRNRIAITPDGRIRVSSAGMPFAERVVVVSGTEQLWREISIPVVTSWNLSL